VQTNPANYTKRFSMTTGHMLVAAAGPMMNLVLAVLVSVVIVVLGKAGVLSPALQEGLIRYLLLLNIMLLFFNLIPLGPLDGASVLAGVLPPSMSRLVELNRKYGMLVLLALFFTPGLGLLLGPVYRLAAAWIGWLSGVVPA
jgi:Zn-dependent protease